MSQSQKEILMKALLEEFSSRARDLQSEIQSLEDSRNNESKSTAGDKHEVGRAMAQNELENLSKRLAEQKERINLLSSLDLKKHDTIQLGSLVKTQTGTFFIALGYGKINFDGATYFVVSPVAPIGQAMMKKKAGEHYWFHGAEILIQSIE